MHASVLRSPAMLLPTQAHAHAHTHTRARAHLRRHGALCELEPAVALGVVVRVGLKAHLVGAERKRVARQVLKGPCGETKAASRYMLHRWVGCVHVRVRVGVASQQVHSLHACCATRLLRYMYGCRGKMPACQRQSIVHSAHACLPAWPDCGVRSMRGRRDAVRALDRFHARSEHAHSHGAHGSSRPQRQRRCGHRLARTHRPQCRPASWAGGAGSGRRTPARSSSCC